MLAGVDTCAGRIWILKAGNGGRFRDFTLNHKEEVSGMRKMSGFAGKLVLGLVLLAIAAVFFPQPTSAFSLAVENSYPQTLNFAVVNFDDRSNQWQVHGWWSVPPNDTKTVEFPGSTGNQYVYLFGYAGKLVFDGRGTTGAQNYTIIDDNFDYYLPNGTCPPGKNRRPATFIRLDFDEDEAYWLPRPG